MQQGIYDYSESERVQLIAVEGVESEVECKVNDLLNAHACIVTRP